MTVTVSIITIEIMRITVKIVHGNAKLVETRLINASNVMEKIEFYLLVIVRLDISE